GNSTLSLSLTRSSVSKGHLPQTPPSPRPHQEKNIFERFMNIANPVHGFKYEASLSYNGEPWKRMNFLELLGMTTQTSTTTRRSFYLFDRSKQNDPVQGSGHIDSILNALMR
ncbi:hypothetical protein PENTCL1PPCAC_13096, partial [Pristionchus entomophagus]